MDFLKTRLAVVVTLAVVFAPGSGGQADAERASSSDVGARMLAPTFDEAAERSIGLIHKGSDRAPSRNQKMFSWIPSVSAPEPFSLLLPALLVTALLRLPRIQRFHSGRAPPHPLTV